MPRLPKPGGDAGNWGEVLNEFLTVEHTSDGKLNPSGTISLKYTKPETGIPKTDLESSLQADINKIPTHETTLTAIQQDGWVTRDRLAEDVASSVAGAGRIGRWKKGGFNDKKIVFLGDSTTSNATTLFNRLRTYHTDAAGYLSGLSSPTENILNFGENGATLAAFLANSVGYGIDAAVEAKADLYILSYGINDVRLGLTSQAQLESMLVTAVEALRSGVPTADIVLRVPNSLLSTDVNGNGWVQPNASAHEYTEALRHAYLVMEHRWPNVAIFDAQDRVFGTKAQTSSSYMADQLHPSVAGQVALADSLAEFIGEADVFSLDLADQAMLDAPDNPWTIYPRVLEDERYFDLVAWGDYIGQGSTYIDFSWPGALAKQIKAAIDIVWMGNVEPFVIPAGSSVGASGANTRLAVSSPPPANTMTSGLVKVFRRRYGDQNLSTWAARTVEYSYLRRGIITNGGTGYIDVARWPGDDTDSKFWNPSKSDSLVIQGHSGTVALSSANFGLVGVNLRILISGDYAGLVNKQALLVGAHRQESGLTVIASVDIGSVAAGAIVDTDVSVDGATTDGYVVAQPPAISAGLIWSCRVKSANTVTVRMHNTTESDVDPMVATWRFLLMR